MKILGFPASINVRKVLWTCAELGISPEREDWGGNTRSTSDPYFLSLNPKGLVPVLIDEDFVLSESNTICRYLVTKMGREDLLPVDPIGRAKVETWMDWQATELNTSWRIPFMALVRGNSAYNNPDTLKSSVSEWNHLMRLLDKQLEKTSCFVTGDTFTLADIVLALSTNRWEQTPIDHADLPSIKAWMERLSERAAFLTYCRNGQP